MLKKTTILLSLIFAGSLLVGLVDKADRTMITAKEVQKMNNLRTKIIQSNAIKAQKSLSKKPMELEKSPMTIKEYQLKLDIKESQLVSERNGKKIRGLNEHQLNSSGEKSPPGKDFSALQLFVFFLNFLSTIFNTSSDNFL